MFEIRCDKANGEHTAIRSLARRVNAYLEVCDEEPGTVWYTMTELPGEPDADEIEQQIAAITCSYERIDP